MDGAVRGGQLRVAGWLLAAPAAFLALFYAVPLARTLQLGLGQADWAWLGTPYVQSRVVIALVQALLSVALTLAIALPLAYVHHRYEIRASRWHLALHASIFVLPVFVVVYGIQLILPGMPALLAVVVAHAYYNYGFATRILHATLDKRPRRLEAAAATLGASPRSAAWRVTIPLLLPSIAAVALLVFLFSFSSFGVVLFLGGGQVSTLETMTYQNLGGAFARTDRAALLAGLQLVINLALFLGYSALRRKARGLESSTPRRARSAVAETIAWGALALGLAPALAVLAGGFRVGGAWTLEAWRALLDPNHPAHLAGFDLPRALALSLGYAVASAMLALALAILLAYATRLLAPKSRAWVDAISALPLGTSSLVLGIGFLLAFGAGSWLDLRGSYLAIVCVHALVAFPFAARVLLPAFDLHDRRLDEAAATLGASPLAVARRIHLPLLAAPLTIAAGLSAAMSLGDFGASVLLMRADNMGLVVWISRLDAPFNPLLHAQAVALAGFLMVLVGTIFVLAERASPGEVGQF